MEARLTAPLSARMLELARVASGLRVLDLATGRGEPAIAAARRVAPGGTVIGVDPAADMLAMARERATREGVTNLELVVGDAANLEHLAPGRFDAVLARWGLMYLQAPRDALTGACRALVPGGRLVAAVWAEPARVSYVSLPRLALARHAPTPPLDGAPAGPDTFYYAEPSRLQRDLEATGFTVEHVEEHDLAVMEAATPEALVDWVRAFGMARLVDHLPVATQRAWEADVIAAAEPLRQDGLYRLGGVTRVVVATPAARAT